MPDPIGTILPSAGRAIVELLKTEGGFIDGDLAMKSVVDAASSAKVSMFLFQVAVNAAMRNAAPEEVGLDALRPPPLPLDLIYLLTPLSQDADTALGHLESVMRVFHDHPVMKAPLLPAILVDAGNEVLRITPHALTLEDTNRLWAMFPNKGYSLSVSYLVSPLYVPSARTLPVTRVAEKVTRVFRTERPA